MKGPNLTLEAIIYRRDQDGKLVEKEHRIVPTNSWVRQAAELFIGFTQFTTVSTVIDVLGGSRTLDGDSGSVMRTQASSASEGIIVGTGTAALDRDDFAISGVDETGLIQDGATSGRLNYEKPQIILGPLAITGGYRITHQRDFDNNSGATITVNESAIYTVTNQSAASDFRMMIIRDLVSPGLPILNNELLTLRYHFDFKV